MKVMLDIKDAKAPFLLEMLEQLSFVKVTPVNSEKSEVLDGLKKSIQELNLIKQGKLKSRNAEDLFNEL